jgi:nucleotide-binding universal stress UspA family protein
MLKKILLAYDGSEGAKQALKFALDLAKVHQAEVCAVAVAERSPIQEISPGELEAETDFFNRYYQDQLAKAQEVAAEAGIALKTQLETGHPAQSIVKAAEDGNVDLIVLGHRGLSGVWAKLLGSVAEKVSTHAHCSVLIVR